LAFLRSIETPGDLPDLFETADEYALEPVYHNGIAFYDPAPDESLKVASIETLMRFL
jgi:hypothetical protein